MRSSFLTILLLPCVAVGTLNLACSPGPTHRSVSDHFDGVHFHNRPPYTPDSFWDGARLFWSIADHRHRWPEQPVPAQTTSPAARVPCGLHATVIGHATILIQLDGLNILTDPVMGERIGVNRLLSEKRAIPPGLSLEQLPVIDVILISHNHFDHLDIPSLQAIERRQPEHAPLVLTGLGNAALLRKHGIGNTKEMDWGDSVLFSGERIAFLEAVHESGRTNYLDDKSLWGSFLIESTSGKLYFAGDSAYGNHFRRIGQSFGSIDMSFLPIGAYEPHTFLYRHHMSPAEAVQAHEDLGSAKSVGIHFNVFNSAADRFDQPREDLQIALTNAKLPQSAFVASSPGEMVSLPCHGPSASADQRIFTENTPTSQMPSR